MANYSILTVLLLVLVSFDLLHDSFLVTNAESQDDKKLYGAGNLKSMPKYRTMYNEMKVMSNGNLLATISVKLINGDGENPADVYGRITGRFSIEHEFVLFDLKATQHIRVRPGAFIPLSGMQVNVPSSAPTLEIAAHLMDYDQMSSDDEIAYGRATFLTKASGTDRRAITGRYGSIEVTVVWS